ncbi:hypothetical protein C8P64_2610 [Christiangramia gaetbulicola]|uniref:Uncharacterized protein n=1 Tax=Christiangramia gaetbulicola TaxID=703340 RepID=A0A2T6AEE3_9FLAO|nr:hypothetical protein [Christiangramia gaetbulicola]PTX42191.1 hypothetical protein C8P64_2610 [Christiangramia gaetbulicola]
MENEKYLKDLSEIKNMMNRSSRFISLSGLSGVFAGCYAILGAVMAKMVLNSNTSYYNESYESVSSGIANTDVTLQLVTIALAVLVLAIGTAIFLTTRKARKNEQKIWDSTSKRLVVNFFAPLIAGGLFCVVLLQYNLIGLIAPSMLIFYGLALIHASKYTFADLKGLGYANLILGLVATQFIGYGLYFWAIGFGLFHIIYGIWMHNKYDRKSA